MRRNERIRLSTEGDGVRVILPVLGRPDRAAVVHESLRDSEGDVPLRGVFVMNEGDRATFDVVRALATDYIVIGHRRPGDYAIKCNTAAALTEEPWVFTGADDIRFHPRWAERAIEYARLEGKRAIGVNDMGRWADRRGFPHPSPHFLVARSYIEELGTIDHRGHIFHQGYDHWYVDTEFTATADARGEYGWCSNSMVEHLHPVWRKGHRDAIYTMGARRNRHDHRIFQTREHLWKSTSPS